MLHSQVLSLREKSLAIVAGALLLLLAIFGYSHVAAEAQTNALLAQDAQPTATGTPTVSEKPTDPREAENQTNNVRDQVNYAKNLRREIEDIKRDLKGTTSTSDAEANLTKFDACLVARQAEIGLQTFYDNMRTCQDISTLIEDALRDTLRPLRDCGNYTKNLTDRKREFSSNIEKQLKDIKRNVKDTAALDAQMAAMKDLLTRWEQAIAACNASNSQDVDSFRQDADDAFRDAYDALNEANEQSNQARRLTENQRDYEKNYKRQYEKDMARELKNFEKEFAKVQKVNLVTADTQVAYDNIKKIYADLGAYIASMQAALTAGDMDAFDDARNEFNTYQRDFWDILNESRQTVNQQQQAKDVLKEIVQKEKELEKMKKEYERVAKQAGEAGGASNEVIKALLDQYAKVIAEAKQAVAADPQSWWNDYQQQLNDIQNEFWNSQQKVQQVGDVSRWMKDIERDLGNREKDLKNMSKDKQFNADVIKKLGEILNQMKAAVSEAKNTLSADPDSARDLLQSIDDLRMQWDETSRFVFERKQMEFEVGRQKAELKWTIGEINSMAASGRISSEEKASCLAFAEEVLADFDRVLAGEIENPEEHFGDIEERALRACPAFEKLNRVNPDPSVNAGYYKEFVKENVSGIDQDAAAAMLEKVSQDVVAKVLQRLMSDPTAVASLLKIAGQDKTVSTMESMVNFYDDSAQKDLIAKKAEIVALNEQIKQLSAQVQIAKDKLAELTAVQNQIANYNFYGNAGDQIRTDIEKFIADAQVKGLSKEQIRVRIDEFKAKAAAAIVQSKQAKVDAGIIPFTDTDDNEWYTKYVAPLAKLGIVKGKGGGKFDPGSSVTVAELVTMAFRVSGDPEIGGNVNSTLCGGKFAGQWSNKFLAWAESRGLSVVGKCTDANRPALRWEVAQTLGEIAVGGKLPASAVSCFSDVKISDQTTNSVVCWAKEHGVMSGSNGKANAYGNVNRGEAATMVKQAAEKLFGIDFGNGGEEQQEQQPQELKNSAEVEEEYVPTE